MIPVHEKNMTREMLPGGVAGFLQRRWMILIVPLLLAPSVSLIKSARTPPVYRSTAHLLVEESNLRSPLLDSYALQMDIEAQLRALEKIANRPILLDRLADLLETEDEDYLDPENLATLLELNVAADGSVRLSAHGSSPKEARLLAAAYQDVCSGELNRPRVEAARAILGFLESELGAAQVNLDRSHMSLAEYRAAHGKVLPELEAITYNLLLAMEAEQVDLDARRHALAEHRAQLEADPTVRGRTVSGLEEQISSLQNDLATAEKRMTALHPELQKMRSRLDRLFLDLELRRQGLTPPSDGKTRSRAEDEYRLILIEQFALEERISRVDFRVNELQQKIAAASGHDAKYVLRLRDVESHSEIYLDLVRRRERAATSLHLVEVNHGDIVRVIESPTSTDIPESPQPLTDLILGLATGLIAGLGLAATAELTDRKIHSPHNLALSLGAPTLLLIEDQA